MSQVVRYGILVISLLCSAFFIANTVLFNFTVICMNPKNRVGTSKVTTTTPANLNISAEQLEDLNDLSGGIYTNHEEGYILSAVALGAMLGTFPCIHITEVLGLRTTFTAIGLLSGVSTFVMPLWYRNVWIVLAVRFVQGFGMACASVAIGIIPLTWGGTTQKGIFVSVLTCCYQLGPILAMPLAGVFCSSPLGWKWAYYVFGVGTIVVFIIFFLIYSNKPHKNRFASSIKVRPLREPQKLPKTKESVPYGKIFSTLSIWGVLVTGLGDCLGYMVFVLYGPIYINKVLNFDVTNTGLLSAIPYVFSIFTKFLGGIFLDKATCVSDTTRVMFFTALSQVLMAVSFLGLTFLHSDTPMLAEVVFICAIVVSGLHHIGLMGAFHIVAGKYTHVLSSVIALLDGLIGLLLPRFVALVSHNHDNSEWTILFYWISGVLIVSDIIFVLITRMKPASWSGVDIRSRAKFSFRQSNYEKSEEPVVVLQTIHSNGIDEW
uniref:MFS domain-containing protein n=1 Tax=Steinernema glaseri TaxID=37863 RepID=A0A1I7YD07_9BILA